MTANRNTTGSAGAVVLVLIVLVAATGGGMWFLVQRREAAKQKLRDEITEIEKQKPPGGDNQPKRVLPEGYGGELNSQLLDTLKAIRVELSEIRKLLAESRSSETPSMPDGPRAAANDAEWSVLLRRAESNSVVEEVTIHRRRLLLMLDGFHGFEENPDLDRGQKDESAAIVADHRRALEALEHVRTFDDLFRWQSEFNQPNVR